MAGAWIFFTTFIALFITATAQVEICTKKTCGPGDACNRIKCDEHNGTCMRKENCTSRDPITGCPGGCVKPGWGKWCKYYRKCSCCMPNLCDPQCVNGFCMNNLTDHFNPHQHPHGDGARCICDPGWLLPACNEPYCEQGCVNGFCTGPNQCTCDPGWIGPACDDFICDNPACVNGICTGPNNCTCDPGWRDPACDEFYCDPDCQNGDTCEGPNNCAAACKNAKKCNNVNGICYHNSDPILQNCTNTFIGRYCSSKSCTCCW